MESQSLVIKKFFWYIGTFGLDLRTDMTLTLKPELGIAIPDEVKQLDLPERMEAAANTAVALEDHGLDIVPSREDRDVAATLTNAYAEDPEKLSKKANANRVSELTPASIVLTSNLLQEFGHAVVESSVQVRHLVTNKLLLETENADPKHRLKALELLGKISDVGLFAEKSEITITHQSTDDLRAKLRGKLEKLVNPPEDEEDIVIFDDEPIDVCEELGFDDEEEERS